MCVSTPLVERIDVASDSLLASTELVAPLATFPPFRGLGAFVFGVLSELTIRNYVCEWHIPTYVTRFSAKSYVPSTGACRRRAVVIATIAHDVASDADIHMGNI